MRTSIWCAFVNSEKYPASGLMRVSLPYRVWGGKGTQVAALFRRQVAGGAQGVGWRIFSSVDLAR